VPALENTPDLFIEAIPYWTAFAELTNSRQLGMSIGPIPYSEISSWLDENIIYQIEDRHLYRHLISKIDSEFVAIQNEKQT
jgi:hypothetical protein